MLHRALLLLLLLLPAEAFARPVEDLSHKEDVFNVQLHTAWTLPMLVCANDVQRAASCLLLLQVYRRQKR